MRLVLVLGILLFRSYQHALQLFPACAIICTLEFRHYVLRRTLDTANARTSIKVMVSKFIFTCSFPSV